ncbi:hypothetical protein PybrP1_002698 [[Pythium] brassicae (nom. inval.)]|nr:hypothetical protein PybrP1_002698 [[Pythium] brassicae (nom. inval.)]
MRPLPLPAALVVVVVVVVVIGTSAAATPQTKDDLKPLSSFDGYDALAVALMVVGLAAASAGGVGGGTILVPLLVLVMGFDIKFATPSSNFIIMGGAVANAIFNLRKRHPFADRPLVDPDICVAMIPTMMGGAVVGAFLSKLLPSYVISILFVLLLAATGVRTVQKGIKLHNKETAAKEAASAAAAAAAGGAPATSVPSPSLNDTAFQEARTPDAHVEVSVGTEQDTRALVKDREQELRDLLEAERHFSWPKHAAIFVCYLGIVAASIGGAKAECGSVTYWVVLWAEVPWVLCFTAFFVVYMGKRRAYKRALGFQFVAGDIEWSGKTAVYFPLGCVLAGVVAGLFGVGGAIIAGPLMLEMGVVPEVASSSSALLVLYSSASATAKFALFNQIAWDWSVMLCGVAFVVTTVAQIYILSYVRRTGRQSIIVFCIATSVCLGACLMTYTAIKTTIDHAGDSFTVDFCK